MSWHDMELRFGAGVRNSRSRLANHFASERDLAASDVALRRRELTERSGCVLTAGLIGDEAALLVELQMKASHEASANRQERLRQNELLGWATKEQVAAKVRHATKDEASWKISQDSGLLGKGWMGKARSMMNTIVSCLNSFEVHVLKASLYNGYENANGSL